MCSFRVDDYKSTQGQTSKAKIIVKAAGCQGTLAVKIQDVL